ncbi:DinB family protein, partial [Hymenobacter agri]
SALPAPLPVVRCQLDPHLAPEILLPTASAPAPVVPLVLPAADIAASSSSVATTVSSTRSIPHAMPHIRPTEGDYLPYALGYINQIPADQDPLAALRAQPQEIHAVFAGLSEAQAEKPYADGKWSLKEMLLHQIDSERIFAYRALRFARGDDQDLRGFEQDDYVANSNANARAIASLLAEYDAVRAATLALFEHFGEEELSRRGTANGGPATVRALLYIIPGHERHHLNIIRERYLPIL